MNLQRILTIDRCLRNRERNWTLDDLIEACEHTERNSKRSVQADIELMRNKIKGYSAPIKVVDRKYYTYSDKKYNILNHVMNDIDKNNIKAALDTLHNLCYFNELKVIKPQLIDLHNNIAKITNIPLPDTDDEFQPKEHVEIRLWIDESLAEYYTQHRIHYSQKLEQEEIDGSINIYLRMPILPKFIKLLVENHTNIIVNQPQSLKKEIQNLTHPH